jgi:hypothetical protein
MENNKKDGQVIDMIKAARLLILKDAYKKHYKKVDELEVHQARRDRGIRVVRVEVGSEDWGLFTEEAYKEFRLTLSTGDYHMHRTSYEWVEDYSNVQTLDEVTAMFSTGEE